MTARLLLVHGDDRFGIDQRVNRFAADIGAVERTDVLPVTSPDEAAIDRARLAAASVAMFGMHLAVLRQPLRAAGRSTAGADRLLALVGQVPDGAALVLAEERASRDMARPPALLARLAAAVSEQGGVVEEVQAPRRGELRGWIAGHALASGIAIQPAAAALLAERIGGGVWETDVERGEQTRIADTELRKLALHAGDRAIGVGDIELLTADTRPASVFAITNALDRREPAAAAEALRRALDDGEPVLRILGSLAGRVSDLIVAREMAARGATPHEMAARLARGNARVAQRVVEGARRYSESELEEMLRGLFEADLAVKENRVDPESAVSAWMGEYLLGARPSNPRGAG